MENLYASNGVFGMINEQRRLPMLLSQERSDACHLKMARSMEFDSSFNMPEEMWMFG
jgi:hypothetical protein